MLRKYIFLLLLIVFGVYLFLIDKVSDWSLNEKGKMMLLKQLKMEGRFLLPFSVHPSNNYIEMYILIQ